MLQNNDYYKLIHGDCIKILDSFPDKCFNMIFADPPYFLSNGGITCKNGKMACVDKGEWDKSKGLTNDFDFTHTWLKNCDRVLKDDGTVWISGTYHNIHMIGYILNLMGYYIINEISWIKPNAPPNMGCRCFTASHETLLWAKKDKRQKHIFNYKFMKELNEGKQMRSFWIIPTTPKREKIFGKHPTQKPEKLLYRCIMACTNEGDLILDPFCSSGTTGVVAIKNKRRFIGIDINQEYLEISRKRIEDCITEETYEL